MFNVYNVSKKYGKLVANDNISFSVEDGQIAVLLGPNGAGKSTIIKCIAGLLRFNGKIDICGNNNKTIEAKKLLGYIPEMPAVYDLLTVKEHLEFIGRTYELNNWEKYGNELLTRFELYNKKDKLGKELSKNYMRLSLCFICLFL